MSGECDAHWNPTDFVRSAAQPQGDRAALVERLKYHAAWIECGPRVSPEWQEVADIMNAAARALSARTEAACPTCGNQRLAPTWEQMAAIGNAGVRPAEMRRSSPPDQLPLPKRPLMGKRPEAGEAGLPDWFATPDDFAEHLFRIGWTSPCDVGWTKIREVWSALRKPGGSG